MKFAGSIIGLLLWLVGFNSAAAERMTINTVNYPLQYFAERIAGDHAEVRFPAPDDVDPAFWKLDAATIGAYQRADLILLNGAGYAKWVNSVSLPRRRLVDTSASFADQLIGTDSGITHSHGSGDDHAHTGTAFTTWLDPQQAIMQARAIKQALVKKIPSAKTEFERNFALLEQDLGALDSQLQEILSNARGQALLASHSVYQYFARAYQLDLHSVLWEPDKFPGETEWEELADLVLTHKASWMLWEGEPLSGSTARLAQLGIESVVFDPCANVPEQGDFLSVMKHNLAELKRAF